MMLEAKHRNLVNRAVAQARYYERQRAVGEVSDVVDQLIAEKNALREKAAEMQAWFENEIKALHAQLHAAQDKLRMIELLDMFAKTERDWSKPLH